MTQLHEVVDLHGSPRPSRSRRAGAVDHERLARAVREMLLAIGEDPERDGLRETPERVARACAELFAGLADDPARHLARAFDEGTGDLVLLRAIDFTSTCEHHLLPVLGTAHVAYLPAPGRVVGLSKIARTVELFARRPQLQERMTAEIADALIEHAGARGALVIVEGEHMCLRMRGVGKRGAVMRTMAARGELARDDARRREATELLLAGS